MKLAEDTAANPAEPVAAPQKTSTRRLAFATIAFCVLIAVFWLIAWYFRVKQLEDHPVSTCISFALLFAPYWFFGFGAAADLRRILSRPITRIAAASLLTLPYFVLSIPRHEFDWPLAVVLILLATLSAAVLERWKSPGNWADVAVLATAGLVIDLGLLNTAGPLAVKGMTLWPPG